LAAAVQKAAQRTQSGADALTANTASEAQSLGMMPVQAEQ